MTRSRTLTTTTDFLFGASLSLLPAVGPIVAALLVVSQRWRLQWRDAPWLTAAVLLGAAGWTSEGAAAGLRGFATVVGPWLVYRTFADLAATDRHRSQRPALALGLLAGFAALFLFGLKQTIARFDLDQSATLLGAIVWQGSPAAFGHGMLVLGGAIALAVPGMRLVRATALTIALAGILVAGNLEAAVAWSLLVATIAIGDSQRPILQRLATAGVAIAATWTLIVLAPIVGWGRIGFVVAGAGAAAPGTNMLTGTELPRGGWWMDHWVDVSTESAPVGSAVDPLVGYEVRKRGPATWYRLQQTVTLSPGETYTLSAWIATPPSTEAIPGLQGWGRVEGSERAVALLGELREEGWSARMRGPAMLVASGAESTAPGWQRVHATFRLRDDAGPVTWFVGFVPDVRDQRGETGRFAGLMLESGEGPSAYRPGGAAFGLGLGYARVPIWQTAWSGFLERPWRGWGDGAFAAYYEENRAGDDRFAATPHHAHNIFLSMLFERGVLGVLALSVLVGALSVAAVRDQDVGMIGLLGSVAIVMLVDSTLLQGAVLFPLAAIAGWRSSLRPHAAGTNTAPTSSVLVRTLLAVTDVAVLTSVLVVAHGVTRWLGDVPTAFAWPYGLLLWPALMWREGLYPGYGLTPAQELKRQTIAWAQASIALLVLAVLTPLAPQLDAYGYVAFFLLSLLLLPPGRALTKRTLLTMGLWGRPVVILGAGETGQRIIRALQRTPLDGLHAAAVFDDDVNLHGSRIGSTEVVGTLDDAAGYARRHGIRDVVVAISRLDSGRRTRVLSREALPFLNVQYIPRLDSLPSYDVNTKEIDGLLALESKVGLASATNRTIKRTFDVFAVVTGGLLISPLLLALAAAVRLESRGPVFYGQGRIGRNGRTFTAWKFRSMRPDADEVLASYLDAHPELRKEWEATHKLKDDPRVTRVGRFLRATSLDELPQIWNVLLAEMSLVGPRPIVDAEIVKYGDVFELYKLVPPGITGHWQVSGRSDTTYDERVAMDAHYVRNWSIWFDIVILVNTFPAVTRRDGAY